MTNLLTNDEIQYLLDGVHSSNTWTLVERTIAATVAKLAAGVSMEPVGTAREHKTHEPRPAYDTFYRHQMEAAIAAARVQALEESAKVCEHESCSCCWTEDATELASHLTDAIRALIGANHE